MTIQSLNTGLYSASSVPMIEATYSYLTDDTPVEALPLLLQGLYEQSHSALNTQSKHQLQLLNQQIETAQKRHLELIEIYTEKQLALLQSKENAVLGKFIRNTLVSVMATAAVINLGSGLTATLAGITALLNGAETAIKLVDYIQAKYGYSPYETLSNRISTVFIDTIKNYVPNALQYLPEQMHLVVDAFTISTLFLANIKTTGSLHLYSLGQTVLHGFEIVHGVEIANKEKQLADIHAEQKVNQALQALLKRNLETLQKSVRTHHRALEDYIKSTSDAINAHSEALQTMIHHIN